MGQVAVAGGGGGSGFAVSVDDGGGAGGAVDLPVLPILTSACPGWVCYVRIHTAVFS